MNGRIARRYAPSWALLVGVAGVLGLVACGNDKSQSASAVKSQDLPSLATAAKKETGFLFYCSTPAAICTAVADAFKAEYGIEAKFVRAGTGDLQQRWAGEASSGQMVASAAIVVHSKWGDDMVAKGWAVPAKDAPIPDISSYPKTLFQESAAVVGSEAYAMTYNTDLVKPEDLPKDWPGLADPKWKGKLILTDVKSSPSYLQAWDVLRKKYGDDVIKAIAANVRQTTSGLTTTYAAIASGEGQIALFGFGSATAPQKKSRAPVADFVPDYAPMFNHSLVLTAPKLAPAPNTALLFANFVMVGKGQEALNPLDQGRGSPVTGKGVPSKGVPLDVSSMDRADEIYALFAKPK